MSARVNSSSVSQNLTDDAALAFGGQRLFLAVVQIAELCMVQAELVQDFVAAWAKVMNLDRFELA